MIVDSGALQSARPGCVHVMMATISLALVDELKALHRDAGVGYVAAPVFGVPAAAAKAELNVIVAGEAAAVAKVRPALDVLGRKTWPVGDDPARANVVKIAGNLMITFAIEAMGEASALTESYGVPARDFLDILTNTLFASPSYQRYGGFIGSDTYEPGFKLHARPEGRQPRARGRAREARVAAGRRADPREHDEGRRRGTRREGLVDPREDGASTRRTRRRRRVAAVTATRPGLRDGRPAPPRAGR